MPPRRSSRARASASVEPMPADPPPMKRKRNQRPSVDVEEKENVEKPVSKSRRSSAARSAPDVSSRSRTSTRKEPTEPTVDEEVPETDEGEEDDDDEAPPPKKKRPSLEQEEDFEAEDDEDDEYEEEKSRSKSRRATQSRTKPAAKRGRPSRVASKPRSRPSKVVQIESDEEVKPEKDDDPDTIMEEESEVEEYELPKRKSRTPKAPLKSKPKASGRRTSAEEIIEEEQEEEDTVPAAAEKAKEEEEEEEETSLLLDHPPSLPPASQPQVQTIPEEPKGPQSRLVIHKLALINFKSYAGRQEIGPFHKSFSSIVGANGSGKSNTIDALLFVFGYRAAKMRQGKLSELIHNSARYPDLDECSVEVYFREIIDLPGPDSFEVVPDSQLVVARHAYKSNGSTYTINGRNSSYSEVQKLLKGRGIDLDHKRFLILQGEVESIAQMKPKGGEHDDGLLEYLEDIIGTSKYKEPIEEAFVELESLQESRQEKLNRLRLVEKEKNALEDKKKEAEDYLRLQNDLSRVKSKLYQFYLWQILGLETQAKERKERAETELEQETEKNKDDIQHAEELEQHYKELEKGYKIVQKVAVAAAKELADHEKQEVALTERKKAAAVKAKKLKKSVGDATAAKRTAQHTIEDSDEKIEKEKGNLAEFEKSLDAEEQVLDEIQESLRDKTQKFYDQKEVLQRELQPWTAKINAKQTELDVARGERDALAKKDESRKKELTEAEEFVTRLNAEQGEKIENHGKAKKEMAQLKNNIQIATEKVNKEQQKERDWRAKASSTNQKVQEAKASQAETRSQGKVLDSLTRLRDSGRITGFHGRLGSLGTIPAEYDVAVTTACGALNNMVVDTVDQGQKCIEYLRSQNVGRASFLVIEKINPSASSMAKIATPENAPRLFDLITPRDPKFAPVFYKAVGDTLVAKDIDQANRLAFGDRNKRWKVVTLAGQLIETSGAMSGGGGAPSRGGMSAKLAKDSVSPETLRNYEKEREEAQMNLEEASRAVREAEAELEQLKRAGPDIELQFSKLGMDIETGKNRINEAEKRLRDLRSHSKPDKADVQRIQVLEQNIHTFESDLEKLKVKASEIEAALEEIEEKILKIGGSKLLAQKSKVEGLRNHINLTNDAITNAEVAKAKAEKDLVKHKNTITNDAATLETAEAEFAELEEQFTELQTYMEGLRAKVEEAEAAEESERENLAERKAELEEKLEQVEAFRQTEIKLRKAVDGYNKELKECVERFTHWERMHDELTLEDIDEDDDEEEEAEGATVEEDSRTNGDDDVKPDPDEPSKKKSSSGFRTYKSSELAKMRERDMRSEMHKLEDQLNSLKPNLNVLEEYKRREAEYFSRHDDLEKVGQQRDAQKKLYEDLRKQRLDEFMTGFSAISLKLKEMYQMITQGGNAELELVDSMDPFAEGIIFSVMPPKKSWKNISNLSGGEKTLSSLALVFALHVFKPTPLYFMDEIDAALDFRNVSIIANYIKDRTKNAQFIIISLRNDMFEMSHRLIGIYKTANATQSISIDNHALTARPVNPNASVSASPAKPA